MLSNAEWSYQSRSKIAEFLFLLFISVLSPIAVGLQIFSNLSFMWSLVLLNILNLPSIILFYRGYLPYTVGKRKFLLAILLLPVYLLVYEFNARASAITLMNLPFIPEGYQRNLASGNPQNFNDAFFFQTLGYTSLVLLAATSLYFFRLLLRHQEKTYKLENENLRLELTHLKTQIHPHFFFNTLNNLYSLSIQHSPLTPNVIKDLSTIMRYVLYDTSHGKVALAQEIDFIKSYIHLENIRHSGHQLVELSIQGIPNGVEIEPLLILPLIENTFKHSLRKEMDAKWVKAILVVDEDEITFQTSNPFVQSTETISAKQEGIGLINLKKRLELLYPQKHDFFVEKDGNVFIATLTIKLN